jgi:hypothetical protein
MKVLAGGPWAKWRAGVGLFVENQKGDLSKFVIFKNSPWAGGSITFP